MGLAVDACEIRHQVIGLIGGGLTPMSLDGLLPKCCRMSPSSNPFGTLSSAGQTSHFPLYVCCFFGAVPVISVPQNIPCFMAGHEPLKKIVSGKLTYFLFTIDMVSGKRLRVNYGKPPFFYRENQP